VKKKDRNHNTKIEKKGRLFRPFFWQSKEAFKSSNRA
jgi:hypothetical protein